MGQDDADMALAMLFAEAGGALELYLASGKKKHSRYFWASINDGTIAWDKKKGPKPNKVEPLESVEASPAIMTARQWFDAIDVNQDGSLDADEVGTLYQTARGEKLGKKDLAKAMAAMDITRTGRVSFNEFDLWWKEAGGDLEKHRERAMTVVAGDVQLLLVAPDTQTKDQWIAGLQAILMLQGKAARPAPAPEPEPAIPASAAETPAAAERRERSASPAARLTPVDSSSFTPVGPSPIASSPSDTGAEMPSAATGAKKPAPVKAATAWWLAQHGGADAVPLSPGSVEQLGVWAATRKTAQGYAPPTTSSVADSTDSSRPKKSHDGYGALPVKTKDPITDPGVDSTGAETPLVPPPAPDAPAASPGPPVTADRHHAQSSTMNAVTSRWRDGDASEVPSSARSVSSVGGGSPSRVVETPRADCFDEDSNHHPEGHWHQVKKEGEFSQHLSAHFLSRNASNGALFVDAETLASGAGAGSQSVAAVHSVVEAERTLAGFADHGRGCHTPKYLDMPDEPGSHGLKVRI